MTKVVQEAGEMSRGESDVDRRKRLPMKTDAIANTFRADGGSMGEFRWRADGARGFDVVYLWK